MPNRTILFEDCHWERFLPLVYLRGLFELRCGAGELWQRVERLRRLDSGGRGPARVWCRSELADLIGEQTAAIVNQPCDTGAGAGTLLLSGRGFWHQLPEVDEHAPAWVGTVGVGTVGVGTSGVGTSGSDAAGNGDDIACVWADAALAATLTPEVMLDETALRKALEGLPRKDITHLVTLFRWPWELPLYNGTAIESDFRLQPLEGVDAPLSGVHLLNPGEIHIGDGTRIKPCVVIDAEEGPVWIGDNVTIQPHVYIQGPCYIGDDCLIQPGAVIREACSFGQRCKVGGEVEASIIHSFSNKQHDGFLGHAYIGQWINIGADCLNSDLKNTYGTVRVPINGTEVETGEQFVGLLMGDFSKTGVNVAFPTGAVVGLCSNIVVPSSPKFVPSFTWIGPTGTQEFDIDRALASAEKMMSRRDRTVSSSLKQAIHGAAAIAMAIESD